MEVRKNLENRRNVPGDEKRRIWHRIKMLLIAASVLAAIKVIFADYTLDEEYQIVMAYRNLAGDTLFGTMWEPHQTSAFVCIWFMRLFRAVTGSTTGVVLFLRVVTTGIQLLLSGWLARQLGRILEKDYAFLLGCCYFNMVPKIIQIPEFSNLQLWFFTVIVLALMEYYGRTDRKGLKAKGWLAAAALSMALEVLAYPASVILFFFFEAVIFLRSRDAAALGEDNIAGSGAANRRQAIRDCLIFGGICAACAAVWLAAVLSKVPWQEFVRNLKYILEFDLTHDVSLTAEYRIFAILRDMKTLALLLAVTCGLAAAMWILYRAFSLLITGRRFRNGTNAEQPGTAGMLQGLDSSAAAVMLVLASELVQLFYWVILRKGYEEPQIHLQVLLLAALVVWRKADERKRILRAGFLGGILTILAVLYMSDLGIWYAIPHGLVGVIFAAAVLVCALERQQKEKSRGWILLLLLSLSFCAVFGKGFTLRAGTTDTNTVLGIRGVIRHGPAAGIFTNYMQAYITNCTYEDFAEYVEDGENCMIVTNMVGTAGTSPYMFRDLQVSHFSIVDPTSYDERLLTYWELYPEKRPDVIVVDCWYGQLMEDENNWIMQYIEKDFGYRTVEDGRYVRFYLR